MDRTILHCDINNCYASIESMLNPKLRHVPLVVGGSEEDRHGVVLAKNELAKKYGIKTGESLYLARKKCQNITIVSPHFDEYLKYTTICKEIYYEYTNFVEDFGLDEAWLDCTESINLFGDGYEIAKNISDRIKLEVGITISVGVSFNKIFAKLGSDMKKPDGITVITRENFREKIWNIDVGELLGVGKSTKKKLNIYGIKTIGDLAKKDINFLKRLLGINGIKLRNYANGKDTSEVKDRNDKSIPKSIGRGTTYREDIYNPSDIKRALSDLAYRVCNELKKRGYKCKAVEVSIRDPYLKWETHQKQLNIEIDTPTKMIETSYEIIKDKYDLSKKIRALSVRAIKLVDIKEFAQLNLFEYIKSQNNTKADDMMYKINDKFGENTLIRASDLLENKGSNETPDWYKMPNGNF